jgi:hypothetical protein
MVNLNPLGEPITRSSRDQRKKKYTIARLITSRRFTQPEKYRMSCCDNFAQSGAITKQFQVVFLTF